MRLSSPDTKLTASMTIGPQVRAVCRRHHGPDARIMSPLPNLRLEPGASVAELAHHAPLEPMNATALAGSATVKLRGESLHVQVTADRQVHIHLRRCPIVQGDGSEGFGRLLLVVTACGGSEPAAVSSASFDLSERDGFAGLAAADLARLAPRQLEALSHTSVQGLSTRGWLASAPAPHRPPPAPLTEPLDLADILRPAPEIADRAYFARRMKDEICAALQAKEPGVASRHVQIATLMARRLQRQPWAGNGMDI